MADIRADGAAVAGMAPVTEEVFLDDRKKFWSFFTGLVTTALIGLVVLLLLMAFFLL